MMTVDEREEDEKETEMGEGWSDWEGEREDEAGNRTGGRKKVLLNEKRVFV